MVRERKPRKAHPSVSRLRPQAKDLPPGVSEYTRVEGIIGLKLEKWVNEANIAPVQTKVLHYAVHTMEYILSQDRGKTMPINWKAKFPPTPPLVKFDDVSMRETAALHQRISKELTERLRNRTGRCYSNMIDVFMFAPWAAGLVRKLYEETEEGQKSLKIALEIKKKFCDISDTNSLENYRTFTNTVNSDGDSITTLMKKHTVPLDHEKVVIYGGGTRDFGLSKEVHIVKPTSVVANVERDSVTGVFGEIPKGKTGDTVISINALTQRGTKTPKEVMALAEASLMIFVVPIGAPHGIAAAARRARYDLEKVNDDPDKLRQYQLEASDPLKCSHLREMENTIYCEFGEIELTYSKKDPQIPLEIDTRCIGEDVRPEKRIRAKKIVIKPKFDGVAHYLTINQGQFSLLPRTIDLHKNLHRFVSGTTTSNVRLNALVEILPHGKLHVCRVYNCNGRAFAGHTYVSVALEKALRLKDFNPVLEVCAGECDCPTDGAIVDNDGKESFHKDINTIDIYKGDTEYKGIRGVEFETFEIVGEGKEVLIENRIAPRYTKKRFQKRGYIPKSVPLKALGGPPKGRAEVRDLQITYDLHTLPKPPSQTNCTTCDTTTIIRTCEHGGMCANHPCYECDPAVHKQLTSIEKKVFCSHCTLPADWSLCSCGRSICHSCALEEKLICDNVGDVRISVRIPPEEEDE